MTLAMKFIIISIISVVPSLVAFFESKKSEEVFKKIYTTLGAVFIPSHLIFSTTSILTKTNFIIDEKFVSIINITWFSLVFFILAEVALFSSTVFYFVKGLLNLKAERAICISFAVVTGLFGIVFSVYHYYIDTINFVNMLLYLLPFALHTAVLVLNVIKYKKVKTSNKIFKK